MHTIEEKISDRCFALIDILNHVPQIRTSVNRVESARLVLALNAFLDEVSAAARDLSEHKQELELRLNRLSVVE